MPADGAGYYIGVDLGGSRTKIGVSGRSGDILARRSVPTRGDEGPGPVVREIARAVDELVEEAELARSSLHGIGIGSPGPLDTERGVIIHTPNLKWRDVPIREMVGNAVGVRTVLDNDGNTAAFGEWWKGAGFGAESLVCLTLGTGIGGGIVIGGEIWHGASDIAGEIGHMTIVVDGRECNCGNRGCFEAYASATGICSRAREEIETGRPSNLAKAVRGDLNAITSEIIFQQATGGDPLCREIMVETGRYLAVGVANILNILNPEVVVIGGGVAEAGELIFSPLLEEVGEHAFPMAVEKARIVPAALGNDAGMIGAIGLVRREVEGSLVP
jgi:glucokinase